MTSEVAEWPKEIFKVIDQIKGQGIESGKVYDAVVIGGDFNSAHKEWGSKDSWKNRYNEKYKDGKELYLASQENNFRIWNNGQPTRYWLKEDEIKYSRIDLTLTEGISDDGLSWKVDETDYRSDHFQIDIQLKLDFKRRRIHEMRSGIDIKYRWQLSDDENLWKNMRSILRNNWEDSKEERQRIQNGNESNEVKSDRMTRKIIQLYREAAADTWTGEADQTNLKWAGLTAKMEGKGRKTGSEVTCRDRKLRK